MTRTISSPIVIALAAGAAASNAGIATELLRKSYDSLKALIAKRYPNIDLQRLEEEPQSEALRAVGLDCRFFRGNRS